jgi:alkylation response protein AidB-like acyl-CoA dehydrogenase
LIAGAVLSAGYAAAALQTEWCAKVAGGEALVVLAHQERKARYNSPLPARPQAEAAGDTWTVTGAKSVVPAGDQADAWLVPAMANGSLALFLVAKGASGADHTWVCHPRRQHVLPNWL